MTNCLTPSCKWRPPGTCVYYSGEFIAGYNINNGDPLDVVVTKLTTFLGTVGVTESPNTAVSSNSATVVLSGAYSRAIQVNVVRDTVLTDNKLAIGVNGLYVPPATFTGEFDGETLLLGVDGTDLEIAIPAVLTTESYSDPSWITDLAPAKVGLTTGTATVLAGTNNIVVTDGAAATTSKIVATVQGTDTTALYCRVTSKSNGSFVLTTNASANADTLIDYIISN